MVKKAVLLVAFSTMFLFSFLLKASPIQATSSPHENAALKFLRDVAGFSMNSYSIAFFEESTSPSSQHCLTLLRAEITGNNTNLKARIDFIDGKICCYDLFGDFNTGELDDSELLVRASNCLSAYMTFSNESYCSRFVGLLSTAIQTQASAVENENLSLSISNSEGANYSGSALTVRYNPKVSSYVTSGEFFTISALRNGLLSYLLDNTMYYVDTVVNVTRAEAVALATPNATAYANKFGQTITGTNVTLAYVGDVWNRRGNDDFAMYPEWAVSFTFDKVDNESVSEYDVLIWADNGQVFYSQPQGYFAK